jgi:hypothetical protein
MNENMFKIFSHKENANQNNIEACEIPISMT